MGRKKKVIPTAEAPVADEESGGLDLEEDSGRGLLIAVNKHVVNEEDEDEDDGEDDSEGPKQRKGNVLRLHVTLGTGGDTQFTPLSARTWYSKLAGSAIQIGIQ